MTEREAKHYAFALRVEIHSTREIPADVVFSIVENGKAEEAFQVGVWDWFPGEADDMDDDDMLDVSLVYIGEVEPQ